jgi:hypothetical protein
MKNKWIISILLLPAIVLSSPLYAAPVTYDESIDGDLGFDNLFVLEPANNYIKGSVATGSSSDSDAFYFTVPESFKATVTFPGSIDTAGSPYGVLFSWELHRQVISGNCNVMCSSTYMPYAYQVFVTDDKVPYLLPPGDETISSIPFLSAGTYFLKHKGSVSSFIPEGSEPWENYLYSMNYTASFDLQPVPVPGAFYLFGTSLIALSTASRRKQRAK